MGSVLIDVAKYKHSGICSIGWMCWIILTLLSALASLGIALWTKYDYTVGQIWPAGP